MKSIILFLFLSLGSHAFAQTPLKTETIYYDAVDKWVAYPLKDSVNTYIGAFIYIDPNKGFALDYAKKFSIDATGKFVLKKDQPDLSKGPIRILLPKQWGNVYIIPEAKLKELGVPITPEWLKEFKQNATTPEYAMKIGSAYNKVGAFQKAQDILAKAYATSPNTTALGYELAYAYNALKQHDKAIPILEKELVRTPKICVIYREMIYAYQFSNQMDKAEMTFQKARENCTDPNAVTELGLGFAQYYFGEKNEVKFKEWTGEMKKRVKKDDPYDKFLTKIEGEWEKAKTPK
jgi:tetratricopeptide (TPR) repeat protein